MNTHHKIILGDSRRMSELADKSVHLIITSPPYWQIKDYGFPGQIGFDDTYERYVNNLNLVWRECNRLLHDGCRLCVNIGDQFARSAHYGRYKVIPIRTEVVRFCETIGLDYMGAIIWRKVTTCNTTGGATVMGSFPYPRSGVLKLDYEFILIFRKPGKPPRVDRDTKDRSKLTTEEWNEYFSGHWSFSGEKQSKHVAMFPLELPSRLIRMFSFVGDLVLDPFLGSGTTSVAAINLERSSVGYEINPDFLPLIKERLGIRESSGPAGALETGGATGRGRAKVPGTAAFEVIEQEGPAIDPDREMARLPYVFRDPVCLNRRADSRKRRFGRAEYYSVKEVVSPEVLLLNDGRRVRLLGVRAIPGRKDQAVEFLRSRTRGTKVFLRHDPAAEDSLPAAEGSLPADSGAILACYVYLSNRTFLNAHLLKRGLADVDTSVDFKHKERFLRYRNQTQTSSASK